jgi:hypothetical protein
LRYVNILDRCRFGQAVEDKTSKHGFCDKTLSDSQYIITASALLLGTSCRQMLVPSKNTLAPPSGLKCDTSRHPRRWRQHCPKNISIQLLYIQMWKFSFITINAVITEGNGYRRDMEFCDQIKNEPTAKLKKMDSMCTYSDKYMRHHSAYSRQYITIKYESTGTYIKLCASPRLGHRRP